MHAYPAVGGLQTTLTGKRRSRLNDSEALVVTAVPELRIVDDDLWVKARTRQAQLDKRQVGNGGESVEPFWSKQRPRCLFSGLVHCGVCGGGYSKISAAHFGCSTARNKGPTACNNMLTIRQDRLESTVLDGLRDRLMDPDLYETFVGEFTREWNRLQAEASGDIAARKTELARVNAQLERLVDALVAGTPVGAIKNRMDSLEGRRLELEAELANNSIPAPRLHPNLAIVYRIR